MRNGPMQAGPADENGSYPIDLGVRGSLLEQGLADLAVGEPAIGLRGTSDTESVKKIKSD